MTDCVPNQTRSAGSQNPFHTMFVKHVLQTRTCKHVLRTQGISILHLLPLEYNWGVPRKLKVKK